MPFVPENELERALVRAVEEPAAAPDFYRLLLSSELLVLGSVEGHESATDAFSVAPGSNVKLVTGLKDGGQYLPLFSSLARMQDYVKEESKFLRVNGRALLDLTRGAPIILNPASEYGKELTPDQVQQLLDGPKIVPRVIEGRAELATQLMEALVQFFTTRADIQTAWMRMVAPADRTHEAHPLLGIETTGDWASLMPALQALVESVASSPVLDVQRVDRHHPAGLAGSLLQGEPFYRRSNPALN